MLSIENSEKATNDKAIKLKIIESYLNSLKELRDNMINAETTGIGDNVLIGIENNIIEINDYNEINTTRKTDKKGNKCIKKKNMIIWGVLISIIIIIIILVVVFLLIKN